MGGAPLRDCHDPFDHEGARERNHARVSATLSASALESASRLHWRDAREPQRAPRLWGCCCAPTAATRTAAARGRIATERGRRRRRSSVVARAAIESALRHTSPRWPRVGSHPPAYHLLAARAGASTGRPVVACEHSRATHGSCEVRGRSVCVGFSLFVEMDCKKERTERRR